MSLWSLVSAVTDARCASVIRIIIGADAALRGLEARSIMLAVTQPDKLQLPFFDWLRVPSQPWLEVYARVWVILAIAFAAGWRTLWTGLALSALMFFSLFFDQQTYSNHLYFISIIVLLLSLAGAGARYSIDAWKGRGALIVAQWPITLLKIQVSLIYFFGSVSKMNADYLSGAVLALNLESGGLITLPPEVRALSICAAFSAVSIVIEMVLAIGLWLRPFRAITAALGIAFHLFIVCLLSAALSGQLAMFAVASIALYPFFFTPCTRSATDPASG